jgi:resuscitation-promoting factor RpfA
MPRIAPVIRASVLIAGCDVVLTWAAGWPAATWQALVAAVDGSAATDGSDQLLGSSAALAAWVCLGWFGLAVCLEVASVLPGAVGRRFAAVAAKTSPMLVRRIAQAVIGVSVLAGPLTAGSALAAGPSTDTSISTQVDRPNSLAAPTAAATPTPLALDRPATAFVPSSPPPTVKRTSAGPAALLTGAAHRDAGDPSDHGAGSYVVRRGDTLWDIAARHLGPGATAVDISREWPAWYDANRTVIGSDPGLISPGELLVTPSASASPVGTR